MTQAGKDAAVAEKKREKRTITEIRESKTTASLPAAGRSSDL